MYTGCLKKQQDYIFSYFNLVLYPMKYYCKYMRSIKHISFYIRLALYGKILNKIVRFKVETQLDNFQNFNYRAI